MRRLFFIKLFFVFCSLAIVGQALYLQLGEHSKLKKLAKSQFQSQFVDFPRRGHIFDRNGEGLALSLKVHSLFVRPELFRRMISTSEQNQILKSLSKILQIPLAELKLKVQSSKSFVWLKRQLTETQERSIKNIGALDYEQALGLVEETKRYYPNNELAAHILGTVGIDNHGLEGLELFYEPILSGEATRLSSIKDAKGRRIFQAEEGLLALNDGQSLVLTIDKAIQYETEKILKQAVEQYQAKAGIVIVGEAKTGEILALANVPTFNPNKPSFALPAHRRNRAITDAYEPGSTFKPLVFAAALEKGIKSNVQIYCERGAFKVGDRVIHEAESHEKFAWLSLRDILKFSSNIGAAKLAIEVGGYSLARFMERIGVGQKTGIDLPGEISGGFSTKELNSIVRLANVGFGHGLTVTALQMFSFYVAFANGGTWVQPKLLKAALTEDPDSLEKGLIRYKVGPRLETVQTRRLFTSGLITEITKMLKAVVEATGTASQAELEEWGVAGKTGTSQKVDFFTKQYSTNKYVTSFIGYAPSDAPEIVALVLLDEPTKKYYAGETAAPVFKEIMRVSLLKNKILPKDQSQKIQRIANQSSIQSVLSLLTQQQVQQGIEKKIEGEKLNALTHCIVPDLCPTNPMAMPNLKGLSVREALRVLDDKTQNYEIIGSGILKDQWPIPNEPLKKNTKVQLIFEESGL